MSLEATVQRPPYKPFGEILRQTRAEGGEERSGLDLYDTLKWYRANKDFLKITMTDRVFRRFPAELPENNGLQRVQISVPLLEKLTSLFPQAARDRSIATRLEDSPPLWFHKDSPKDGPKPTADIGEAMSPTAIITGGTFYERDEMRKLNAKILLCQIPDTDGSGDTEISRLVLAETYVHEYFHTLTTNLIHGTDYLQLPHGKLIRGNEFMLSVFGELAEKSGPISHYSSAYREGLAFKGDASDQLTGIGEEFAETGTTYLLGYASGSLTDISTDPFADRPEMPLLFDDFLHARFATQEQAEANPESIINADTLIAEYKRQSQDTGEV